MQEKPYLTIPVRRVEGAIVAHTKIDAKLHGLAVLPLRLNGNGYIVVRLRGKTIGLHRLILGLPCGDPRQADHINRDRLDNRRSNLRAIDSRANCMNRASIAGSASLYRGVTLDRERRRWRATLQVDRRQVRLGRYGTELEAAIAIERWRLAHGPLGWERDPLLPENLAL